MKRTLLVAPGILLIAVVAVAAPAPPKAPPPSKPGARTPAKPTAKTPAKSKAPLSGPMAFLPKELDLAPGESYPVELYVPSPTEKHFTGDVTFNAAKGLTVTPDPR